jgi:cell division transport system permease protein
VRKTSTLAALFSEAVSGLLRARRMTGLCVAIIAVSIFLVGAFFLVAENLRGVVETVRDETAVTVFLAPAATEADRADLIRIANESRLVSRIRYVSAEEARSRFSTWWKSLASAAGSLSSNPFPASLELDLTREAPGSAALSGFLKNLAAHRAAEEVQYDVEWIRRLRGAVALARSGGLVLAVLLALGAAFTIANVVRLTILLHRDEIEILRLVGAPEVLIRGPFLLGGLAQGFLGGVVAVGALALFYKLLLAWVAATENGLLGVFFFRFLPPSTSGMLVLGGLAAGLLGGAIAVRRRNLEG